MTGSIRNKKICLVTPEYPPQQWGGLARTVEKVSHHAAAIGLEAHVAQMDVKNTPVVLLDENRETRKLDGVVVHRLTVGREQMRGKERDLWDCPHTLTLQMMYHSLEMLHREEGFDLFHSFFLYPVGFVTGMLARRVGRPAIVTLVGNDIKKYVFSPEKVAVCRSGLENADLVVALSQDLVDMAHALTPVAEKARIIYNSVDVPPHGWNRPEPQGRPFVIGCAGIFKYAKGLPYLMKAVAALGKSRNVKLELLGHLRDSEKEVYQSVIRSTGIRDNLDFRDALPHERIPEWLGSLDAFVLPSVSEGCPNILMEAMAMGVPCVATSVGAVEALMEDHVSGLIVPCGNSEALTKAIAELMDNPDFARNLGDAARVGMREFSRERELRDWERIYREVIDF